MKFGAVVMAAGLGTRMASTEPKVLHKICGKPLLLHIVELLLSMEAQKIAVIVNHGKEKVIEALNVALSAQQKKRVLWIDQKKPLGTGHAVLQAKSAFQRFSYPMVILSGDVPAIEAKHIYDLLEIHQQQNPQITFATAHLPIETPYGRVIRHGGDVVEIKEAKECTPDELKIREMNLGLYVSSAENVFSLLPQVKNDNSKKEFYVTDLIKLATTKQALCLEQAESLLGINTKMDLAHEERVMRNKLNEKWMQAGVTLEHPETTYIDPDVKLGQDVVLEPNVHLKGKTVIASHTVIRTGTIVEDSIIGEHCTIGPYARIRPGCRIEKEVRIGNFVELKNTRMGEASKAAHLTYLGDADIGKRVNIGCGVITCNYDGGLRYAHKAKTKIGDDVFVGSDCQLIAPLVIEKGAYIASGSTVTHKAPKDSLVIARARQVTKKNYMPMLKKRLKRTS